jgi:hypothetical protein
LTSAKMHPEAPTRKGRHQAATRSGP